MIEPIFQNITERLTLHSHSKWLVNGLKLLERIDAKPLVIIIFFKTFDKTGNFAVLMICCGVPALANQYISMQK